MTDEKSLPRGARKSVELARSDLADRLGIDPAAVEFVSFEEVVWPDTSMGCPHPQMRYTQVPQDGMRIVLAVEGKTYQYHAGGGRGPFLCESRSALQ